MRGWWVNALAAVMNAAVINGSSGPQPDSASAPLAYGARCREAGSGRDDNGRVSHGIEDDTVDVRETKRRGR